MNRRNFLKLSAVTSASLLIPYSLFSEDSSDYASLFPTFDATDKIVVNLLLDGGPDFRHLIVPIPSENEEDYGYWYWSSRTNIFNISSGYSSHLAYFEENYFEVELNSQTFGVLKKAEWLKNEIEMENVAIVSNVYISENRDHSHSMLRLERGDVTATAHEYDKTGWGGRIADNLNKNVLSLSRNVRVICNAPSETFPESHDNERVISAYQSREIGLYDDDTTTKMNNDEYWRSDKDILSRALRSYYEAKADEISENSIYYKPIQHEKNLRAFGSKVQERLNDETGISIPTELEQANISMNSTYFGQQIRSLYDTYACQDIFNTAVISLDYGGWDSHKNQKNQIEPKFEDMFGLDKGFAQLKTLFETYMSSALDNSVLVVSGEFGRQLAGNGDAGTDHGRGNTVLVIGNPVNGGLYGELFPESEIIQGDDGKNRYETANTDIEGQTSFEFIIEAIAKWQGIESLDTIISTELTDDRRIETNVSFENLFKS